MDKKKSKNLDRPMPCKGSFVYDLGTGERSQSGTRITKGKGDLRSVKSQNNGK